MFFADSYKALRRGERLRALRFFMISVLVIALIGVPVGFFMLRRLEASVIFHPERAALGGVWRVPRGAEEVWFRNAEGMKLHGWLFRSTTDDPESEGGWNRQNVFDVMSASESQALDGSFYKDW